MDLYYCIHWRCWRDIGGEPGDAGGDEIGDFHHCLKKERLKTFLILKKILNMEVVFNWYSLKIFFPAFHIQFEF